MRDLVSLTRAEWDSYSIPFLLCLARIATQNNKCSFPCKWQYSTKILYSWSIGSKHGLGKASLSPPNRANSQTHPISTPITLWASILLTFLIAESKYLTQISLDEERWIWSHHSKVCCLPWRGRNRVENGFNVSWPVHSYLLFFLWSSLGLQLTADHHLHSRSSSYLFPGVTLTDIHIQSSKCFIIHWEMKLSHGWWRTIQMSKLRFSHKQSMH